MLLEDEVFTEFNIKIFSKVLIKLTDGGIAWIVADTVTENFDKLPGNVQNLLFRLADNKGAAGSVARAVSYNFDKLPGNVRNEMLLKLRAKRDAAKYVAWAVADNFDKLPGSILQNTL